MMLFDIVQFCIFLSLMFSTLVVSAPTDSEQTKIKELTDNVRELTEQVKVINGSLEEGEFNRVMFYAVITNKHLTYNSHSILKFETVIVNEGNNYDPHNGVFVAPKTGLYFFSWTVTAYEKKYIVTELVVEQHVYSTAGEYNSGGGYASGSMTALVKMEKGNHAWIRTTTLTTDHQIYSNDNYPQSSFLGWLVHSIDA